MPRLSVPVIMCELIRITSAVILPAWNTTYPSFSPLEAPKDPEHPRDDAFHAALVAAGYRVDVLPDFSSGDGETFGLEYYLYEQGK